MSLFDSDVYDAFREVGVSHEKALAAAAALYAAPRVPALVPPPVPLIPSAWFLGLAIVLLGSALMFAGYILCQQGHVDEQAARSRALIERLQPGPQP